MNSEIVREHAALNRLQTVLLVVVLFAIGGIAGHLLFGETGFWLSLVAIVLSLALQPVATARLTLLLYRARPIAPDEAPQLWRMLDLLARRAGLPAVPQPHYVPSGMINAFAVGSRRHSAIALTDGLLGSLTPRELLAVLAHETAHIANGDLRVMNLADYVSRLTGAFAILGLLLLLTALPGVWLGQLEVQWLGFLLLAVSPHLARLAQMGLSRVREFDADLCAATLTGDPAALAAALARIEAVARGWRGWLLPGWGNPEPSWLRTHPPTAERIRRLLALEVPSWSDDWTLPDRPERRAAPHRQSRWHPSGIWR